MPTVPPTPAFEHPSLGFRPAVLLGLVAVEVTVEDNGQGFDEQLVSPGQGLVGMQDRIVSAGGEIEVASTPGGGTTVRCLVPVEGALVEA